MWRRGEAKGIFLLRLSPVALVTKILRELPEILITHAINIHLARAVMCSEFVKVVITNLKEIRNLLFIFSDSEYIIYQLIHNCVVYRQ